MRSLRFIKILLLFSCFCFTCIIPSSLTFYFPKLHISYFPPIFLIFLYFISFFLLFFFFFFFFIYSCLINVFLLLVSCLCPVLLTSCPLFLLSLSKTHGHLGLYHFALNRQRYLRNPASYKLIPHP
jgi:hypothetical protein